MHSAYLSSLKITNPVFIHLFTYFNIYLYIYLSIYLTPYLFLYLFVHIPLVHSCVRDSKIARN